MGRLTEVRKADRDQNSFKAPVPTSTTSPKGPNQTVTLKAPSAYEPTLGGNKVGRNQRKDQNSTPGVSWVRTPRGPQGKFVSHTNDYQVFHPQRYGSTNRQARDSRVGVWRKDRDDVSRTFSGKQKEKVGKADEPRKGMLGTVDLGSMQSATGARVGRRMA